jgi:small subunit ribosomal protein S3
VGQKTNPVGLRLGIIRGWDSNWFGGKHYADKLVEDEKIRTYLNTRLPRAGISKVVIERFPKRLILTIHTARPGVVIGKGGQEVEKLREEIKKLTDKEIQLNIYEVKRPEIDAKLIGENIAGQLQARISYRRAMKSAIAAAMRMGAEGIKVTLSGRLGGAEMSRLESYKEGRVPLQTLRADIDYAITTAHTIQGAIGIKVWVFKGEIYGKVDLSPESQAQQRGSSGRPVSLGGGERSERGGRGGERGGRGGGGGGRGGGDRGRGPGGSGRGGSGGGGGGRGTGGGDRRPRKT